MSIHTELLTAAKALIEAKDNKMETPTAWRLLRKAVQRAERARAAKSFDIGNKVRCSILGENGTIAGFDACGLAIVDLEAGGTEYLPTSNLQKLNA